MRSLILLIAFTLSCSVGLAQTQPSASNEKSGFEGKGRDGVSNLPPGIKVKPCREARVRAYFDKFVTQLPPTVVTQGRQIARSSRTRSRARLSTSDSAWLSQFRQDVKAEVQTLKVDFSKMDIEALVQYIMMLAAEEMQKEMKEILKDMKESLKEKEALRRKISKLKEDICRFIDQKERANNEGRSPR